MVATFWLTRDKSGSFARPLQSVIDVTDDGACVPSISAMLELTLEFRALLLNLGARIIELPLSLLHPIQLHLGSDQGNDITIS